MSPKWDKYYFISNQNKRDLTEFKIQKQQNETATIYVLELSRSEKSGQLLKRAITEDYSSPIGSAITQLGYCDRGI